MQASDQEIKSFLDSKGTVAVVGASSNEKKAGHFVPAFLKEIGFRIIPINPMVSELFGEKTLKDLEDLDEEVNGIIIYRKQEIAENVALKAIDLGIPLIWLPENITSKKAEDAATEKGLLFVEDKCPMKEARTLNRK